MDKRSQNQAQKRLSETQALVDRAKAAFAQGDKLAAETLCRQGLEKLREAHLLAPTDSAYRKKLHELGRVVHDTFNCRVEFRDGSYWVSCPVLLSHSTVGFSVGGSAKVTCSICGEDNLACPHVRGRTYDGVIARRWMGF